jgi:hypothetical protein
MAEVGSIGFAIKMLIEVMEAAAIVAAAGIDQKGTSNGYLEKMRATEARISEGTERLTGRR